MKNAIILKIGGNVLDNPGLLQSVLDSFACWDEYKILVHGGGKIANVLMKQLGIEPVMLDGRRVTDEKSLEVVTMVYAGWINKSIVSQLQSKNCNAFGCTGADGNIIPALKRPVKEVDYGFVGDIDPLRINTQTLAALLDLTLVPVIAPITHDKHGQLLNTNADTIASSLAVALAGSFNVKLVFCFEKNGVLSDPENEASVIGLIKEPDFIDYKAKGAIHSGMVPKLENAFTALKAGVSEVNICGPMAFATTNAVAGTTIKL